MGMGAQNRGATGVPAPTQMAMQGGAAPQGLMALMQQRGKGGGMPGGMPPGVAAPGGAQFSAMNFTPRPATMGLDGMPIQRADDPQMLAQMQALQQQGGQGSMPGAPGKGGGMPMPKMPGVIDSGGMPGGVPVQRPMPFDPRRPMPGGAGGKGAGLPPGLNRPMPMPLPPGLNRPMPMPMPPGSMVNPPRPKVQNNPRAQAVQSVNPRLAQMMRGGSR